MLIQFSVENYRSFRDRATLSMAAANLKPSDGQIDENNCIQANNKLTVLRSALIYGANASGKSNLIRAFGLMRNLVLTSASATHAEDTTGVEPFLLDEKTAPAPSTFEVVFLLDGVRYRYGFSADADCITAEWLCYTPSSREATLFAREGQEFYCSRTFKEGKGLGQRTRPNALFLSVAAQFNGETATKVRQWFCPTGSTVISSDPHATMAITMAALGNPDFRQRVEAVVCRLDLGIVALGWKLVPVPDDLRVFAQELLKTLVAREGTPDYPRLSEGVTVPELLTEHVVRGRNGAAVGRKEFAAQSSESDGTQRTIALLGPMLQALDAGDTLFVDEIDTSLHPLMTQSLIGLFNSPVTNSNNAQLICTTHDTNLLNRDLLRRDQIYFTEKDSAEASHLYSLAEFKSRDGKSRTERIDANYAKGYIQGRYGAIPFLGDLRSLFEVRRTTTSAGD